MEWRYGNEHLDFSFFGIWSYTFDWVYSCTNGQGAEMEKVKVEFNRSLPMLEKAYALNPADENCVNALKQVYEILEMKAKGANL